jgi:hypothetical protein
MDIHAGIALGSITEDVPFVCTRFDGVEPLRVHKPFIPYLPTKHALHSSNPEDIMSSIPRETNLEHMKHLRTFALSYPIATSDVQRATFEVVNRDCHDHCTAFLSACQFGVGNSQHIVESLFIDLTPGQVAAMVVQGVVDAGNWTPKDVREKAVLGKVDTMTVEKFDELVALVAPDLSILECVAVLRPEGAFPELLPIKLELKFVNIPFKLVSLADLSYGSAMLLYRRLGLESRRPYRRGFRRSPDIHYVELADGTFLDITKHDRPMPIKTRYIFTTSKDNQVTATVRFGTKSVRYKGSVEYEEFVIRGLEPRPKGDARISVILEHDTINIGGGQVVTIRDLGSNLDVSLLLREKQRNGIEEIGGTSVDAPVQYAQLAYRIDGVIGELPE